jgi:HlyD family secretion protein
MRRFVNVVLGVGGLVAIAALLAFLFAPTPILVDVAEVSRGDVVVTVDDEGETRVKEIYVVSAPVTGLLKRIERHAGDVVTAGETVVASIQPTDPTFLDARSRGQAEAAARAAEAATVLAEAAVAQAEAELEFARSDYERAERLSERQTISQRGLERAVLEVKTREAALATAQASLRVQIFELETARARLISPGEALVQAGGACCIELRAPASGRVLRVLHESEGVIAAGTPLVEIGDPADLEIVVELLSAESVRIAQGVPVMIEEWGGGEILNGAVRRIEPTASTKVSALGIEEQRVNVIIDFTDPPAARAALGHGFRVQAQIVASRAEYVVKVPLGALFRQGPDWAVFVAADDGRARLRKITVGQRNIAEGEIVDGLREGERVVLHPSDRIADGVRIAERP